MRDLNCRLIFSVISMARNAGSPFLRLPREIKNEIYKLVLGGQLIHTYRDPHKNETTHYLCQANVSESDAHKVFVASKGPWFSADLTDRHSYCNDGRTFQSRCLRFPDQFVESKSYARLNLALLSCCRQIYLEAHLIAVSANTWSFTKPWDFRIFYLESLIFPLIPLKTDLIRCLHLNITISTESDEFCWNETFKLIARRLKSLQHLYLDIDQRPDPGPLLKKWHFEKPAESSFLEGLRRLKKLSLRTVTVTVSDSQILVWWPSSWEGEGIRLFRWTMVQKQEWAGYITRVLLRQEE